MLMKSVQSSSLGGGGAAPFIIGGRLSCDVAPAGGAPAGGVGPAEMVADCDTGAGGRGGARFFARFVRFSSPCPASGLVSLRHEIGARGTLPG